jgi:tetratricopeptide (TPR) repeat protein
MKSKKLIIFAAIIVLIIGGVILAPKIKRVLTTQPVYRTVQKSEIIPVASVEKSITIVTPASKAILAGAKWVPQTFNNCGPATTSMVLQYFGYNVGQDVTKSALRTNPDDKNVFSYEMQEYVKRDFGIESKLLYNGDIQTIKTLIANGFYVVVEDWLHSNEDIGHVTILRGFDDEKGVLIADDSYLGINIVYKYDTFDQTQWKAFNREYIPFYRTGLEGKLKEIIGENWDTKTMYQNAVKKAQQEIQNNDRDMYAYFNLGTSYFGLGEYEKAWEAFEKSKSIGWPKRMLWYQIQPVQTLNALGKYQEALALADTGLWSNDSFAELHVEKAKAYKGLNNIPKAKEEIQKALVYAPNLKEAKDLASSFD